MRQSAEWYMGCSGLERKQLTYHTWQNENKSKSPLIPHGDILPLVPSHLQAEAPPAQCRLAYEPHSAQGLEIISSLAGLLLSYNPLIDSENHSVCSETRDGRDGLIPGLVFLLILNYFATFSSPSHMWGAEPRPLEQVWKVSWIMIWIWIW